MLNKIEIGTKLLKADAPSYVLEVLAILTRKHELPHARARVCTQRHDLGERLYSVSALEDGRLFMPAEDANDHRDQH